MPYESHMLKLPQRQSLEKQTATVLKEEILRGTWHDWLPGERSLCSMLQVSRHTLRAAIVQLRSEGVISSEQGIGNRIVAREGKPQKKLKSQDVGLLIPGALEQLRQTHILWIDELRAMLAERGCRLHMFSGLKYATRDPGRVLQQLVARHAHAGWVLLLSGEGVQRWFEKQKVPCLVAGSIYDGVDLPWCDVDHYAVCRHAAGLLLGRGHRRVALLTQKSQRAGDIASESGFIEGMKQSSYDGVDVMIGYHEANAQSIALALKRLMQRQPAPTALLVLNPNHYLTVLSSLARLGFRVPEDVSVLSRDGEPFFSYLMPPPDHYRALPKQFAKMLLMPVLQLLEGGTITKRKLNMMPDFIAGQSVSTVTQKKDER
ncbi:substrate-binding domain-containing protein [Oleiharenicola lentus]|uniref:substrate-binding domain-containing protein n=1 Tax=Oleiharenicola lentus TaxID=2508720 RepID=UPI003F678660